MMREMIAAFLIVAAGPAAAQTSTPQQAIEAEMAKSAAGWNAGNLDRFVAIYTTDAVYAAGNELARGRAEIAARYAKSFANGANTRGKLIFQTVAWRTLSPVHMLYIARWTLTGPKTETGLTTLLFERRKEGWRIISDHSS
jgi:uncharacterized protein (TIGR02246 family)